MQGHSSDSESIVSTFRPNLPPDKPILIGIRGKWWYDATEYLRHHPAGGDILLDFAGRDAAAHFLAYHGAKKVLKYCKPVGTYELNKEAPDGEHMQGD